MPKLARQTLWRSGEVAAAGLAALTAASISATSPALANEWYGGTAIGTFSSEWNCENYLCITASHQIDLSAFVYESSTSFPSFYFFQDHFSTLLYGVGPLPYDWRLYLALMVRPKSPPRALPKRDYADALRGRHWYRRHGPHVRARPQATAAR